MPTQPLLFQILFPPLYFARGSEIYRGDSLRCSEMASNGAMAAAAAASGEGGKKEKGNGASKSLASPKGGGGGMCLCSPTTHQGSFRCRHHRSQSTAWMRRSNSMPSSVKPS
ncbi:uncharacterized protein LOC121974293 [Zingiber officinale]|uniref:uncharacterized protein LOC121974293 n=1 Tax=Zingiber officinale TaxID=94328 RepID=UPI001C4B14F1|nr:uncharacterized protein LOC121974293 [Zingiber officinale]